MKILLLSVERKTPGHVSDFEPLGLGYLAACARQAFPDLEIRIAAVGGGEELPGDERFDLVGVSSVTQNFNAALSILKRLAASQTPLLLGGVHISLLPECLPREGRVVGVMGEGERTLVDLIRLLQDEGRFDPQRLSQIAGIAYRREDGSLVVTPRRPPIMPLDSLPFPDRDLLDIRRGATTYLFSSRGCPFKCAFCASTRLHDRLRLFSAGYVVDELAEIIERYRPIHIKFYDDLFVASKPRLREIVRLLTDRGLHRRAIFSINATASMIDEETAGLLRRMNVFSVAMGLESGNPAVLSYLKAGKATVAQNMRAVEILARHGINPSASFIVGAPGEDERAFEDTLEFVRRSKLTNAYLYLLTPYPGTPVWEAAKARGMVSDDMDWDRLDINENERFERRIILSDRLSPAALRSLFQRFGRLARRKHFQRLIAQGVRRPDLILPFFRLHLARG